MAFLEKVNGKLTSKEKGDKCLLDTEGLEYIGIYFSAHWCPPCKNFTPVLVEFYNDVNKDGKKMEIVFVSCDRDTGGFKGYFETMPWMALMFEEEDTKNSLAGEYNVSGIPHLVILDKQGNTLTADGRSFVQSGKKLSDLQTKK